MDETGTVKSFETRFREDREAGRTPTLDEYQRLFPGHERAIADAFTRLIGEQRKLGRYRILGELGRGGQAQVFLAEDTALQRKVALKVMAPAWDANQVERFEREAAAASRLNHPGICPIFEAGEEAGTRYIAMPFLDGRSLEQLIEAAKETARPEASTFSVTAGPTTAKQIEGILRLVERVAEALHAAHEAGLVHRDIKPANILVQRDGNPVILDFGLARDTTGGLKTLTVEGDLMGTPAYMSPEQLLAQRIKLDRRTDIYSLGATLYEFLTLRRPFEAATREALYKQILTEDPPSPTRFNRHVSQDLRVVIETAMEKDRDRRYQTAKDFADDLRRVRTFETIKARPAGLLRRLGKWAHRHPGKAVGAAAVLLAAVIGVGGFAAEGIRRERAVRAHLADAERRLTAGDLDGATEAVARARERDPDSVAPLALRERIEVARQDLARAHDLADAEDARQEAAAKREEYAGVVRRITELTEQVATEGTACNEAYADGERRARFAATESDLAAEKVRAELLLQETRESLERARRLETRWGDPRPETLAAFADFFMDRWRDARERGDEALVRAYGEAVTHNDVERRHEKEILGRGSLLVTVTPPAAEIHLFRYESYETVRRDRPVVPRLVPVPTAGVGRCAGTGDFCAGDLCFLIEGVDEGSPAAKAGLQPGDLVLTVNGLACDTGTVIVHVDEGSRAGDAGVRPWTRLESVNGRAVEHYGDVAELTSARDKLRRVVAGGVTAEAPPDELLGIRSAPIASLVFVRAPEDGITFGCLHDGGPVSVTLKKDEALGVRGVLTAYPLIASAGNRIRPARPLEVDPGSYLVLARCRGCETQRFPLVVPRGGEAHVNLTLNREGSTPPGFVYVPPGPFPFGGDEKAFRPVPAMTLDLPGFFIGATPVTCRDWRPFLEDPEIRKAIAAAPHLIYVPREERDGKMVALLPRDAEGNFTVPERIEQVPVLGIGMSDALAYIGWRNRKAEEQGEAWRYDLPKEEEWEKAARGVDERCYPWGNRFDYSLCVSGRFKPKGMPWAEARYEPRDESPYGVADLAGSRWEYARPFERFGNTPVNRGGAWSLGGDMARICSRGYVDREGTSAAAGFRLIARPKAQ